MYIVQCMSSVDVRKLDRADAREKLGGGDSVKDDMNSFDLSCEDAQDKNDWRGNNRVYEMTV